jgi:hypothetical protein
MANELENALKSTAANVAKYVEDAATLQVETLFVEIGADGSPDFDHAKPVARTLIKLDGDSATIVPVQKTQGGVLQVDNDLFELHQQNVNTAIEYRARMLNALLSTLSSRRPVP